MAAQLAIDVCLRLWDHWVVYATLLLAALIFGASLSLAAAYLLAYEYLKGKATPSHPTKPQRSNRMSVSDDDRADADDEITIVGFSPITLDDTLQADWANSDVRDVRDLGSTSRIVHDPEAADDEPTAAHALILVSAVGQTHRGRRRKRNEDAYVVLHEHNTFVVADGMGGYAGGDIASRLAVNTIQEAFDNDDFEGSTGDDLHRHGAQLAAAIQMANRAIWLHSQSDPQLEGMGTTIVATRFSPRKERVYIGHVGDSRCYRFRDDQFQQLTVDHNLEQMGVQGRNAHMLTRAAGIGPGVEVDVILARPQPGDSYILCSDGLNKMLEDEQIAEGLRVAATPELAVETLVSRANQAGGRDNITVILIQVKTP